MHSETVETIREPRPLDALPVPQLPMRSFVRKKTLLGNNANRIGNIVTTSGFKTGRARGHRPVGGPPSRCIRKSLVAAAPTERRPPKYKVLKPLLTNSPVRKLGPAALLSSTTSGSLS